jgi:hypothetical protein
LDADLVALQEANFSDREWNGFALSCKRKGFVGYYQQGPVSKDRWSTNRFRGGVCWLVRRNVQHLIGDRFSHHGTQGLALWVSGLCIINVYVPPGHESVAMEAWNEFWEAHRLRHKQWAVVGDFNVEPTKSGLAQWLQCVGGQLLSNFSNQGSRWTSNRVIDWCMTNTMNALTYVSHNSSVHLSDHKGFWIQLNQGTVIKVQGRLRPSPRWDKPDAISSEDWQQCLEDMWGRLHNTSETFQKLDQSLNTEIDIGECDQNWVQSEWDLFMSCLRELFLRTLDKLAHDSPEGPLQTEVRNKLRQNGSRHKGNCAKFQLVNCCTRTKGDPSPGEHVRRLRRTLARAYEVRRCCRQNLWPPVGLLNKLWQGESFDHLDCSSLLQKAENQISQLNLQLKQSETQRKSDAIKQWKHGINTGDFKYLGAWIRKQFQAPHNLVLTSQGQKACTPSEALQMIHDYWTHQWSGVRPDSTEASKKLAQDFGVFSKSQPWTNISQGELWQAVRNSNGSAGCDGWSGSELKHLPVPAITCFHQCTCRWFKHGLVPSQFLESRQVCLPKTHKSVDDIHLDISHIRPVSVLSVFWRAYSSAWAKSDQLQAWSKVALHAQVAHGKGMKGCEDLVGDMFDLLASKKGVLTTLDFSQAFDHMAPEISCQALPKIGFSEQLTMLLHQVWTHQVRWLQYDGHTAAQTLSAQRAMPQGDPLSPLLMAVWVSSGLRAIESQQEGTAEYSCYMDDRTFWTQDVDGALDRILKWQAWSRTLGIKENPNKTQIVAKTRRQHQELLSKAPQWAKSEIKILGTSSVTQTRNLTDVENSRIADAMARARILASLPLAWSRRIQAFHAFVLSKAAFGWVGRSPTAEVVNKLFNTMTVSMASQRCGARALKKMFFGANTFLSQVLVTRRLARMHRLLKKDPGMAWHMKPFTPVALLRKDMTNLGFCEKEPWVWKVDEDWFQHVPRDEQVVDLRHDAGYELPQLLHACREAFRRSCLLEFLAHPKRRDATNFRENHEEAALKAAYSEIDFRRTRTFAEALSSCRNLFLGAFMSSACLYRADQKEDLAGLGDTCAFCQQEVGYQHHMFWDCPDNPFNHPIPSNVFQRRMGWVLRTDTGKTPDYLSHMEKSVRRLWSIRHSDGLG